MIPRHRPPFGTASLVGTAVHSLLHSGDTERLERQYQQQLNVRQAVWLPSARYGIARTIQFQINSDAIVLCPAFNCGAVHHAALECQRPVRFVDCMPDRFAMNCSGSGPTGHAVILSELFGQRFAEQDLGQPLVRNAQLRIFDMAMAIPTSADMRRMRPTDVTVLSFGLGKSLYAGWGGMALLHCDSTAAMLRQRRDEELAAASRLNCCRWNADIVLRTVAHKPILYGYLRARQQQHSGDRHESFTINSHEWHRPPTRMQITRSLQNLQQSDTFRQQRMLLSNEYQRQLCGFREDVQLPPQHAEALSHFSVRVPGPCRDTIRQQLWQHGIDIGTLFPFPQQTCCPQDFPQAARAATEVLNLPLSTQLTRRHVMQICDAFKAAVDLTWADGSVTHTSAAA